ncbi:hypothetical protein [Corynebacterium matruchotii]|nr:hypothetical protein [Corynebacterium matruchotii]
MPKHDRLPRPSHGPGVWPVTGHLVLADAWRGRHGNQARQPETR